MAKIGLDKIARQKYCLKHQITTHIWLARALARGAARTDARGVAGAAGRGQRGRGGVARSDVAAGDRLIAVSGAKHTARTGSMGSGFSGSDQFHRVIERFTFH